MTTGLKVELLEDLCKHKNCAQKTEPQLQQRKPTTVSGLSIRPLSRDSNGAKFELS